MKGKIRYMGQIRVRKTFHAEKSTSQSQQNGKIWQIQQQCQFIMTETQASEEEDVGKIVWVYVMQGLGCLAKEFGVYHEGVMEQFLR